MAPTSPVAPSSPDVSIGVDATLEAQAAVGSVTHLLSTTFKEIFARTPIEEEADEVEEEADPEPALAKHGYELEEGEEFFGNNDEDDDGAGGEEKKEAGIPVSSSPGATDSPQEEVAGTSAGGAYAAIICCRLRHSTVFSASWIFIPLFVESA